MPAMPNSSPACSTYCLHIFVNSVLNNLDLLGFANTIWFLLCRDCDLILKVWLPLLGKLNGSSRWHCTAPARGCNDSEFLAPGRLPRVREWSDGLQFKKGKEDLMIGPPASRNKEKPRAQATVFYEFYAMKYDIWYDILCHPLLNRVKWYIETPLYWCCSHYFLFLLLELLP